LKKLTIIAAALFVLGLGQSVSAQYLTLQNGQQEPNQRFEFSFRAIDRPNNRDPNAIATNQNNGRTVLRTDTATDLGGGIGPELGYIFSTEPGCKYEIRGFFTQWDVENNRQGNLASPLLPGLSFNTFNTSYESTMFSLEFNQRRDITPGITTIAGIRYLSLEESIDFNGAGTVVVPPGFTLPISVTNNTESKNPLIGFQVGGETRYYLTQGIHLDGYAKVGLYNNNATRTNTVGTSRTRSVQTNGSNNDATWMSEYALRLHYDLILDHMSMFMGYEGMYLSGVAIAPRQVNIASGISDNENLVFNGMTIGISLRR
jgi:hypothetical protein